MPKQSDIKRVLVIGSGPIIIGQAAEFDYAGAQAVLSLKEEGCEVILANSNPATIMTDAEMADVVYIEPLTKEFIKKIIYKERPDGVLAGLGGQTALNLALELDREGLFEREGIKLLGVNSDTIDKAEDRQLFRDLMKEIGEPVVESKICNTLDQAMEFSHQIGYPLIIRPAYTLGGSGGGIAHNEEELIKTVTSGLEQSPITQILLERSIAGYKEVEYEVMRDSADNAIIVCNMENIDPVGIHTGDSIVVAPSQTLTDREYHILRSASLKIVRTLDIQGGCNVQLALDPHSENYYVIEVNPRVSRSSALASKATGYPIAKMAAKIALGMTLDEITNPVTKKTVACFEPTIDYVVTKIPRWPFDKFHAGDRKLGTQMKATGEVMSMGRTMEESLMKAVRSLELGPEHLKLPELDGVSEQELTKKILQQDDERLYAVAEAFRQGRSVEDLHDLTKIDPYFLRSIEELVITESELEKGELTEELYKRARTNGFTHGLISSLSGTNDENLRDKYAPVYKMVDTCAAEFESKTPYYYSTLDFEDEVEINDEQAPVIVLGSGPIRIGQGIEFDYATVHAVQALKAQGIPAVVVNNNPETVSTDFSTSDRLYFEPLHPEDVLEVIRKERPRGVIVQFGGQTAINLIHDLQKADIPVLGTTVESTDACEDRELFEQVLNTLGIKRPEGATVTSNAEAMDKAKKLGFPLVVRPSYVLGGRAMEIVYSEAELSKYLSTAVDVNPGRPVLLDRYMVGPEVEVDAICDGENVLIPGIMEHVEKAGVHSGDSIAVYPPQNIEKDVQTELVSITEKIAKHLKVKGLINIQFVLQGKEIYVIEVNPRSSRTVPFLSKVTEIPMARVATQCILGAKLTELPYGTGLAPEAKEICVKAPVFSFGKLADVEIALGPEMKSTGEVMGRDLTFSKALYKAFIGSGIKVPTSGTILATIADKDKEDALPILKQYAQIGFQFLSTPGTAKFLRDNGLRAQVIDKIGESDKNIITAVESGQVNLIINTLSKSRTVESDGFKLRRKAVDRGVPCLTSLDTATALAQAMGIDAGKVLSIGSEKY